jgi:predicted HTH transcriptional regulator
MIVRTEADLRQAMQLDSETEHIEFKQAKNNFHFEDLAEYCCALANEGGGSIILGVTDVRPRRIVGTSAFDPPDRTKIGLTAAELQRALPYARWQQSSADVDRANRPHP